MMARRLQWSAVMNANAVKKLSFDKFLDQPAANDTRADDEEHLKMVRRIAGSMVRHLPAHVERDELVSLGYMGLVEAHKRFDPKRGVPFGAFAAMRVRGAMLDWLRQLDPISRDERARLRNTDASASVSLVDFSCAEDYASRGERADDELLKHEQKVLLWRALGKLSERERLVVTRYFFEEKSLKNIGEELKVTESRVCQIVSQVTARLRGLVADSVEEAA